MRTSVFPRDIDPNLLDVLCDTYHLSDTALAPEEVGGYVPRKKMQKPCYKPSLYVL